MWVWVDSVTAAIDGLRPLRWTRRAGCIRRLPAVTDTATKPAPPRTILLAAIALGISAVFGLLATVAERNATFKNWDFDLYKNADIKASHAKNPIKMPSDADIHKTVDQVIRAELMIALVGCLVMAFLAYSLYRGKYWARWSTVGFWLISTLFGGVAGVRAVLVIGIDAPLPYRSTLFVGGLAMIAAVVLVNLRPSIAYLSLSRPARAPRSGRAPRAAGGGGLGALFGPRPAAPAPEPPARTGKASNQGTPGKPAPTRPAPPQSRPKSKPRVDVTASADAAPVKPPANRPRGKSRKN